MQLLHYYKTWKTDYLPISANSKLVNRIIFSTKTCMNGRMPKC